MTTALLVTQDWTVVERNPFTHKSNDCKPFEIQPIISKTLFTWYRLFESVKDHGKYRVWKYIDYLSNESTEFIHTKELRRG